jgi:hypothetical protein
MAKTTATTGPTHELGDPRHPNGGARTPDTPADPKSVRNLPATPGDSPAPLGAKPSTDRVVDVGSDLSFPASDPPAANSSAVEAELAINKQKNPKQRKPDVEGGGRDSDETVDRDNDAAHRKTPDQVKGPA